MSGHHSTKPLVVPIPERGREIKTTRISPSLHLLKILNRDKSKTVCGDPRKIYHEGVKDGKVFFVPDSTLKRMENIVNLHLPIKKQAYYTDPKAHEMSMYEFHLNKLDLLIEKLDAIEAMSESSSESESSEEEPSSKPHSPFDIFIYKLDNIIMKLNDLSWQGGPEQKMLRSGLLKDGEEDKTNDQIDKCYNYNKTAFHMTNTFSRLSKSSVEFSGNSSNFISSTFSGCPLHYVVFGNFEDINTKFQVRKLQSENAQRKPTKSETSKRKNKILRINIVGKLLKNKVGSAEDDIERLDGLEEQGPEVINFTSPIDGHKFNHLCLSGKCIKEKGKNLPFITVLWKDRENNLKNESVQFIVPNELRCSTEEISHERFYTNIDGNEPETHIIKVPSKCTSDINEINKTKNEDGIKNIEKNPPNEMKGLKNLRSSVGHLKHKLSNNIKYFKEKDPSCSPSEEKQKSAEDTCQNIKPRNKRKKKSINICENPIFGQLVEFYVT
uniref:Uncharacterized protein n=1 Tax=Clastoptera arizonana TaxID=38151 RepID=A0A1B6CXP8_9HEMI